MALAMKGGLSLQIGFGYAIEKSSSYRNWCVDPHWKQSGGILDKSSERCFRSRCYHFV